MEPRTKREKAAAQRQALARHYGTIRVSRIYAAFAAGFILATVMSAVVMVVLDGSVP